MAADDPRDSLVLEILRTLRDDIAKLSAKVDNLAAEVRVTNDHVAALIKADNLHSTRFAEIEVRLDRIERRLELSN